MRRVVVFVVGFVVVLAACSSGSSKGAPTSTSKELPTSVASTTTSTSLAATSTSTASAATSTTAAACPNNGSTTPVTTQSHQAALLSEVAATKSGCNDLVVFGFVAKGGAPPSCKISYQPGPFTKDGSGQPVAVSGRAFVVVRCSPASGYDFETAAQTYTGPNRVEATGAHHVREVVKTGDNEGVLSWVIGLDARRGFSVSSSGTPAKQLIVTFS